MIIADDMEVVQGSLGSGKSMVAMIELIYQLKAGGVVACNFTLTDDWAYDLAGQNLAVRFGFQNRLDLAKSYWDRCYKIGNPESMIELSGERGSNLAKMCVGKRKGKREGKGLLILDDCHHFFNARTFTANKEYVSFFANARKYGWRTILITHSVENIDKQIRSYIEIESRFRNLQKVKIPFLPLPLSPFPLFLIVRKYYGLGPGSGSNHSRDIYPFDKRAARLYDTLERFHADDVLDRYQHQGTDPIEKHTNKCSRKVYSSGKRAGCREKEIPYHQIIDPLKDPLPILQQ